MFDKITDKISGTIQLLKDQEKTFRENIPSVFKIPSPSKLLQDYKATGDNNFLEASKESYKEMQQTSDWVTQKNPLKKGFLSSQATFERVEPNAMNAPVLTAGQFNNKPQPILSDANKEAYLYKDMFETEQEPLDWFPESKEVTKKQIDIPDATPETEIGGYNFTNYASDTTHIPDIKQMYSDLKDKLHNVTDVQNEIDRVSNLSTSSSPIKAEDIWDAAKFYGVPPALAVALFRKETRLGIDMGDANKNNPGNILITDEGGEHQYKTMREGIFAAIRELKRREI